jgi:outer membrane protein insertion porin family
VSARGRVRFSVLCACATLLAAATAAAQPSRPIVIKDIAVEGNRRVQEAVILGRVQTKPGSFFNPSQLSEDVRAIFGLGFFDDVQMKVEDFEGGVKVTFVVMERPFVRDIDFTGNKKIATSDLQDKIDLKLGSVYNPVAVQKAKEVLQDHYESEGYFEVQITPEVEKFSDGDVKVVFSINEGRRISIDKIIIRGARGLSEKEIKKALATQEREFWILPGKLQRQRIDEDIERILAVYNDNGYVQARVESHEVQVDRQKAKVTLIFTVVEGPQYRLENLTITGVTLFPESEVLRVVKLKKGDVFSRTKLRDTLREVTDLYSTIGHASADVNPRTEQIESTARVNLVLDINEGPETYVERINISGNVRSQDKILRREIPMHEGELFTLQKLQRAKQRLNNLGFFETVNVSTSPGADKTKVIVNVEVKERPTGIFSLGGGFSSVDSFLGTIDLAQRNFLGRGWEASVRLRLGANTQQGVVSFTEPWLFDRPLSAGFDLFSTSRSFTEYDYDQLGAGIRLSHPFLEYWRWHAQYRISRDRISHLKEDDASLTSALRDQTGTHSTSLVSGAVTRDSRDNVQLPSRGGLLSWAVDVAGLGGDLHYVKTVANATYFKPMWLDHIVSGRIEGAYGASLDSKEFPLFERFYLGGPNSIRSFKFRKLSPKDENGFPIGGTSEVLGNVEYIVPMPLNIRVAGFVDVGNVYGFSQKFDLTDLREAVGAGIRWFSPFGPIRVDYGINADRRKGEDFGALNFSVGSPF